MRGAFCVSATNPIVLVCVKLQACMEWLSKFSARYFSNRSYEKGVRYYRRGSVRLISGNDRSVTASVQGSWKYSVFLDLEENSLNVRCTCPWYDDTASVCKHIWATMMAAEAGGYLSAVASLSSPILKTIKARTDFADDLLPPPKPGQNDRSEWRQ